MRADSKTQGLFVTLPVQQPTLGSLFVAGMTWWLVMQRALGSWLNALRRVCYPC